MADVRKTISQMIAELDVVRPHMQKVYIHKQSKEKYQLLRAVFNEKTNELKAVYCIVALPRIAFERPMAEFLAKFEVSQ